MYTYIIIDDENLIRKGTIKKIENAREDVTCIGEAENGVEGITLIKKLHPDFVILDMQMPVMDGTELLPYLTEHYPEMPLIVISGFQNFDYMKHAISANAIDYLLKPFSREAISDCVASAIKRLENNQNITQQIISSKEQKEAACYEYDIQYLTNLILGFHTGEASITSEKLNFINDTHQLVLLTLYCHQHASQLNIQDWLEEGGFGDLAIYLTNNTYPQIGFLVLFLPNQRAVKVENLLKQITDALLVRAQQNEHTLMIGISHIHSDLKELHTAFKETSEALNQQLLNNPSLCSYVYDEKTEPKQVVWEYEDEFLFRVEAGMQDEIRKLIDQLFHWFQTIPLFTLKDAKYYCYYLSNQCKDILDYYLKLDNTKSSNSRQNIVSHIFHIDELKDYYLQFFLNIGEMLKSENIYAQGNVIDNIQTYIQHNYQKYLTQDFIASLFYLNRSYLSTLFKQKTGMKFVDYLNDVRIERAKELLRNSDRKMYQISKAVGYDNTKYFFRVFKKKMGCSPEQYRSENRREI